MAPDFLILSGQHQVIVGLEVKSRVSKTNGEKLTRQLHNTKKHLEDLLGNLVEGWTFVRCGAYPQVSLT